MSDRSDDGEVEGWADLYASILEPGEVPLFGVRIVVYMKTDGTEEVGWEWDGARGVVRNYQAIGLLEAAKTEWLHNTLHSIDDDDG